MIASTPLPKVKEALLELLGRGPVYLVDTCVFVEVAQCFLFDRQGADQVPDRTDHDILLTADCAWRLMRDGAVRVGSNEDPGGRRRRLVKSWIEKRSWLLEDWLEVERQRAGAAPGLLVRDFHLSDSCELRFELERGYELIVGPYRPRIDYWAINFGGPRIECRLGKYLVECNGD